MLAYIWIVTTRTEPLVQVYLILCRKHYANFNIQRQPKTRHAPTTRTPLNYGVKGQQATPNDDSPILPKEGINIIQEVVGPFAWYSRSIDPTMASTFSSITGRQSTATEQIREEVHQLLDNCTTHPNTAVRYTVSDMIVALHSDASQL